MIGIPTLALSEFLKPLVQDNGLQRVRFFSFIRERTDFGLFDGGREYYCLGALCSSYEGRNASVEFCLSNEQLRQLFICVACLTDDYVSRNEAIARALSRLLWEFLLVLSENPALGLYKNIVGTRVRRVFCLPCASGVAFPTSGTKACRHLV